MTLEDLRAFVCAYEAGNMSEAARQMRCTQAAIAQHVRRLERELHAELFTRMRRGIAPTDLGKTLYEAASGALVNLERVVREIGRFRAAQHEKLRLAVSTHIANVYLRRAILSLSERCPGVQIEIEPANTTEDRLSALREGRADLALVPLEGQTRGLEVQSWVELELALLVHSDHPLAKRKKLRIGDLREIRYIAQSRSSATARHIARALQEVGVSLEPTLVVEDAATTALMVEMGRGETFVPANQARKLERSRRVRVIPVASLPPLELVWVARSFSLLPMAAKELIEICARLTRES